MRGEGLDVRRGSRYLIVLVPGYSPAFPPNIRTMSSTLFIQPNYHVTLDYTLKDGDGELLDASHWEEEPHEPLRYVHGYGMLVPGLELALAGMQPGEQKDIVVTSDAAFGEYDDELLLDIERSEFPNPKTVDVGDEFIAESPDGETVTMRVVEVTDEGVKVDANHPLAGEDLHYAVKVLEIRLATDAEIEEAAHAFEEAGVHTHGPDCDHDHDASGGPNISVLGLVRNKKTTNELH